MAEPLARWAVSVLRAVVLAALALMVVASVVAVDAPLVWRFAGLGAASILAGLAALARRLPPRVVGALAVAATAASIVGGFLWSLAFVSQQGSDFGVYFRCGVDLKPTLAGNLAACQSQYVDVGALYWSRALLYTVPFGWLGGRGIGAFDLYNAALQAAGCALLGAIVWRRLGAAAALVAGLVYGAFHERLFALTLATPDNLALPLTVVALGLCAALPGRRAILAAVALGVVVTALQWSRSTGLFVMASAFATLVVAALSQGRILGPAATLAALVVTIALTSFAGDRLLGATGGEGGFLRSLSALDLTSLQSFLQNYPWGVYFWAAVPEPERASLALSRVAQEFAANGGAWPSYVFNKAAQLASGYGYAWFSGADLSANKDTVLTAAASVPHADAWVWRVALLPALAVAFVGAARAAASPLVVAALGFFAAFAAIVLGLGEAQPRYILVALPALAVLAGAAAAPGLQPARAIVPGLATLAVAGAGVAVIVVALGRLVPLPMRAAVAASPAGCETTPGQVASDGQRVRLTIPAGRRCAAARFPAPGPRTSLFLSDGVYPYRFETPAPSGLAFSISVQGGERTEGALGSSHVVWATVAGAGEITVAASRPGETPATLVVAFPTAR